MIITANQKASELILHDYLLIPVITRFGIKLGFGDKTVEQICLEYNIPTEFFLDIVNAFHDPDFFPNEDLQGFSIKLIVDYLLKSHQFYNKIKIPKIENLINKLHWTKNSDENKNIIIKFFHTYKIEVLEHTSFEELEIYPYVVSLEDAFYNETISESEKNKILTNTIIHYADEHSDLDSKLLDLKNIIIKYLPPSDDEYLINDLLSELFGLESDLKNHTRIENKVLIPKVLLMEKELLSS